MRTVEDRAAILSLFSEVFSAPLLDQNTENDAMSLAEEDKEEFVPTWLAKCREFRVDVRPQCNVAPTHVQIGTVVMPRQHTVWFLGVK